MHTKTGLCFCVQTETPGYNPSVSLGPARPCAVLCKKDVHEVMELYDLCGLTAEQSQAIVNQPIETIVFDEKNPDHTVLVEANRNEKSNKKKTTDYEQRMMGGGVGLKF